jgi:hypothetical protein
MKTDIKNAIKIINDENLCFHCLFLLRNEISAANVYQHLSTRNKIALSLISEVLDGESIKEELGCSICDYVGLVQSTLRWILTTGAICDTIDEEYDKLLDAAAIMLIKVYSDKSLLPIVVDIVFKRNREGCFYNDLVWVVFESHCLDILIFIARYIASEDNRDVQLALRLLAFIPPVKLRTNEDKKKQYNAIIDWIEENKMFLYYTGEGFQQSVNPRPYDISLEAKYLFKPICLESGNINAPLLKGERKQLKLFKRLDLKTRIWLSDNSYSIHKMNRGYWDKWIHMTLDMQISIACRR